jgi:hypothetical protein
MDKFKFNPSIPLQENFDNLIELCILLQACWKKLADGSSSNDLLIQMSQSENIKTLHDTVAVYEEFYNIAVARYMDKRQKHFRALSNDEILNLMRNTNES